MKQSNASDKDTLGFVTLKCMIVEGKQTISCTDSVRTFPYT